MILPDVNLLIYAIDEASPFHERSRAWWDKALSSSATVGLCYATMLGFIRLTTNRRIFVSPLAVAEATGYVSDWLAQPNTVLVVPTSRHWALLEEFLRATGVAADLTTDAHIAALAMEHGFTVYSNDADFARFEGLRWENPIAG